LKAIREAIESTCPGVAYIDTLHLSPLLFPAKPYHKLVKDDKLNVEELNNPLNDAIKARDLFHDEVTAFRALDRSTQEVLFHLLHADEPFKGFFEYMDFRARAQDVVELLRTSLRDEVCANASIETLMRDRAVDLAYAVVLILARDTYSIFPRWLTITRPGVEQVFRILRSTPCLEGCAYCNRALDPTAGLKRFFGFDAFRRFDGEPLQENAVQAAIDRKSLLTIFPTGGGKSLTFQVPALMEGEATKGLTVV